ncbi:hypothetical protein CsSME_00032183 [Camellia sinensis var. sinensis]
MALLLAIKLSLLPMATINRKVLTTMRPSVHSSSPVAY